MARKIIASVLLLFSITLRAHEGMWLPTVLASIHGDMRAEGLLLSADDIYSVNHGSLKDAVVLFGGGCTAEVISEQGLILTNHHCGFSAIANHSTLENDYLKNGFWAATSADELMNEGLTATFIVRMEDVSTQVLAALRADMTELERKAAIKRVGDGLVAEAIASTHYQASVRAFNYGNQFLLIVSETFRDVRLVGAPPSAIGKFGGDTDNWMWPRHNADFSIFRIYAGKDGAPADPSPENIPLTPRHVLPIDIRGVKEGDFDMIFGFPGNTQRYLSSYAVAHVVDTQDPLRIAMRDASLGVIDPAMRASDRTRLAYADRQSSISNSWKKWIGELRGLHELGTIAGKQEFESTYLHRADSAQRPDLRASLLELGPIYREWAPYAIARDLFSELVYNGPQLLEFADRFEDLALRYDTLVAQGKAQEELDRLRKSADAHFKEFDPAIDRAIFLAQWPVYRDRMPAGMLPEGFDVIQLKWKGNAEAFINDLYARSVFTDSARFNAIMQHMNAKAARKLAQDPVFKLSQSCFSAFLDAVRPRYMQLSEKIEAHMRNYVAGLMLLFPERTWWPDANGSLRLSYGHVEGSTPRDGVNYTPFTTLDGVLAKYEPGDAEFDVPQKLIDLHHRRDYGRYGVNGTLPVCFTSSLHTTGGNSGSPVLNGRGELIGLNFDRTWESTMSDVQFDPAKCRNIAVDIRYVLFIIDKFAGATRLVDEMTIVDHNTPAQ